MISRLAMGILSDFYSPWILALTTALCTSISTFVLWGVLSRSYAGLLTFGIAYGTLASGWTSLFTSFVKPIASELYSTAAFTFYSCPSTSEGDPNLSTSLLGILMFSRGIGNILSTPISTALFRHPADSSTGHPSLGFKVAGGRYENMIYYVGTCFAGAGGIALLGWGLEQSRAHSLSRR